MCDLAGRESILELLAGMRGCGMHPFYLQRGLRPAGCSENESPPSGKEQASARAAREGRGSETANSQKNCKSMQPRMSPGRSPGNPSVSQLVFCLLYNTAYMERFTVRHSVTGRFVNTRRLLK